MVIALRDIDDTLHDGGKPADEEAGVLGLWERAETKSSAIIGLILGWEQLEHDSGFEQRLKGCGRCKVFSSARV